MPFKLISQPGKRCLAVRVLDDRRGFQLKIVRIQNLVLAHWPSQEPPYVKESCPLRKLPLSELINDKSFIYIFCNRVLYANNVILLMISNMQQIEWNSE